MTISSSERTAGPFPGTGTTAVLPFAFKVFQPSDVLVVSTDADYQSTALVLSSDYTVTLSTDQNVAPGGIVTLLVPSAVGKSIIITTNMAAVQPFRFTNAGGFFPQNIEDALDRLTILAQQSRGVNALRVPLGETVSELPSAPDRAGMLQGYDATGQPIAVVGAIADSATALNLDLANYLSNTKGAGQVAFNYAMSYSSTSIGGWLKSLAGSIGSTVIGFLRSATGAVLRTLANKLAEDFSVADFGAVGDGVHDDTTAIQAAMDALPAGRTLLFPGTAYKFSSVNFSTAYGRLEGSSVLHGTINVTSPGTMGQSSYFVIDGFTWAPPAADNTVDCIVLKNLAFGTIRSCNFRGVNICISVPPNAGQVYFQDVNRVTVQGCLYDFANYFIKSNYTGAPETYGMGDWTVIDNNGQVLINTVNCVKCDGMIFSRNTCFMPIVQASKREHMVQYSSVYLTIAHNQFFEAGADSIFLSDCLYVTGHGNTHAYPGQNVDGSAWRFEYPGGVPAINANTISGEKILRASTGGIRIGANARNFSLVGNTFFQPGTNDHAQVGPTFSAFGIIEHASTTEIVATGNATYGGTYTFVDGTRNVAKGNYYESVSNVGVFFDRQRVVDVGGSTTPVVIDDKDEIKFTASAAITGFINGVVGSAYKDIQVYFTVGTCTMTHSTTLVLKGATNASPPIDAIMVFRVLEGGKAIELSRNF